VLSKWELLQDHLLRCAHFYKLNSRTRYCNEHWILFCSFLKLNINSRIWEQYIVHVNMYSRTSWSFCTCQNRTLQNLALEERRWDVSVFSERKSVSIILWWNSWLKLNSNWCLFICLLSNRKDNYKTSTRKSWNKQKHTSTHTQRQERKQGIFRHSVRTPAHAIRWENEYACIRIDYY
jgi:hypothetical protein